MVVPDDPNCQHWSVQALIQVRLASASTVRYALLTRRLLWQLVEHNMEVADSFIDIGGIAVVGPCSGFASCWLSSSSCLCRGRDVERSSIGGGVGVGDR